MKIRTDFVTNSSSSSFVALLELEFDNGKWLKLVAESSSGGGGDEYLETPEAHYTVDRYHLQYILEEIARDSLDELTARLKRTVFSGASMEERHLFLEEQKEKIAGANAVAFGRLTIQELTYGEYFSEADPVDLLSSYVSDLISHYDDEGSVDDIVRDMRSQSDFALYTDSALVNMAQAVIAGWDSHGPETKIVQTYTPGKGIDVSIITGEGFLPRETYRRRKRNPEYDMDKRRKKYGQDKINYRKKARELSDRYAECIREHRTIEITGKHFCFVHNYHGFEAIIESEGGFCSWSFERSADYYVFHLSPINTSDDYTTSEQKLDAFDLVYDELSCCLDMVQRGMPVILLSEENYRSEMYRIISAIRWRIHGHLIETNAPVSIEGKHFVLTDLSYEEAVLKTTIPANGGILHSSAVKKADYFVIGSFLYTKN